MSSPFSGRCASSISQQDDFELLSHIQQSWDSIAQTIQELERRGKVIEMTDIDGSGARRLEGDDAIYIRWRIKP